MTPSRCRALAAIVSIVVLSASAPTGAQTIPTPSRSPAEQRVAAAADVVRQLEAAFRIGRASLTDLAEWSERLYEARRDAGAAGAALAAAAQEWVTRMRTIEQLVQAHVNSGSAPSSDMSAATYYRLTAEIELARVNALAAPHH